MFILSLEFLPYSSDLRVININSIDNNIKHGANYTVQVLCVYQLSHSLEQPCKLSSVIYLSYSGRN